MEKPKCKICGERHSGHEPHKFGASPEELPPVAALRSRNAPTQAQPPEPVRTVPAASVTAGETAKFDRVAYQREYMKKWRARRKNV